MRNANKEQTVTVRPPFEGETFADYLLKTGYGAQTSTLFMKSQSVKDIMWNPELAQHQDYDFTIRFSDRYKMGVKEDATVIYLISGRGKKTHFHSCIKFIEQYRDRISPQVYRDYCINMLKLARSQQAPPEIQRYYLKEYSRYKEYIPYRDYIVSMSPVSWQHRIKLKLCYVWGILKTDENKFSY